MGYFELRLTDSRARAELPLCCQQCQRLAYESIELSNEAIYWCEAGLMFPTRKLTCKRQKRMKMMDDKRKRELMDNYDFTFQGEPAAVAGWANDVATVTTSKPGFYNAPWSEIERAANTDGRIFNA